MNSFPFLTLPGAHYWTSRVSLRLESRVTERLVSNELDAVQTGPRLITGLAHYRSANGTNRGASYLYIWNRINVL